MFTWTGSSCSSCIRWAWGIPNSTHCCTQRMCWTMSIAFCSVLFLTFLTFHLGTWWCLSTFKMGRSLNLSLGDTFSYVSHVWNVHHIYVVGTRWADEKAALDGSCLDGRAYRGVYQQVLPKKSNKLIHFEGVSLHYNVCQWNSKSECLCGPYVCSYLSKFNKMVTFVVNGGGGKKNCNKSKGDQIKKLHNIYIHIYINIHVHVHIYIHIFFSLRWFSERWCFCINLLCRRNFRGI